jgi:hypothetical protein
MAHTKVLLDKFRNSKASRGDMVAQHMPGSIVQWLMVCVWVVALLGVSPNLPTGSYFSWDWIEFYRIKG